MLSAGGWTLNQQNLIKFVLVDASGNEVLGLGSSFTLQISKAGGAFIASAGTKAEIGLGWYSYIATTGEADTVGPVAISVIGAGTIQQNLEYVCGSRVITAQEFTYTVTNTATGLPLPGVSCWICTDVAGANIVWFGVTDSFGVARDAAGNLPRLEPGTYKIFRSLAGFTFSDPDTETV